MNLSELLGYGLGVDELEKLAQKGGVEAFGAGTGREGGEDGIVALGLEHHEVVAALKLSHLATEGHALGKKLHEGLVNGIQAQACHQ